MEISIIIVNWNAGVLLVDAVNSILNSNFNLSKIQLIVVDNASIDDSVSMLPDHPSLQVILNSTNIGFGAACNQGYHNSEGRYILLFNPDAKVFSETLKGCIEFMDANENIDVLGAKHLDENGCTQPSCSRFPGFSDFINLSLGLHQIFPSRFRSPIINTELDYKKPSVVDQIMGAFMFIRKSSIEKLDMFMDERFFVYFEDVEFSKRIAISNGTSYYNPEIVIFHKGQGTTSAIKGTRLFYSLQSRIKYIRKYFSTFKAAVLIFFSVCIEPIARIVQLIIRARMSEISEVIKGYSKLYKNLSKSDK